MSDIVNTAISAKASGSVTDPFSQALIFFYDFTKIPMKERLFCRSFSAYTPAERGPLGPSSPSTATRSIRQVSKQKAEAICKEQHKKHINLQANKAPKRNYMNRAYIGLQLWLANTIDRQQCFNHAHWNSCNINLLPRRIDGENDYLSRNRIG